MKSQTWKKFSNIFLVLFLLTLLGAMAYMIFGIVRLLSHFTSFPWWSACMETGMIFSGPLVLELFLLLVFRFQWEKLAKKE